MIGLHWTVTTGWLQACFYSVGLFLFETGNRGLKEELLPQVSRDIIWVPLKLRHRDSMTETG